MLSYHYRLDSLTLRSGVLIQALNLTSWPGDEVGTPPDTLQHTVFFLGAAY